MAQSPNDELLFSGEDGSPSCAAERAVAASDDLDPWKILIVDDEAEVHNVTRLVLSDFSYRRKKLQFISAYTGSEARGAILANPDVAIILLDVVMEENDTGLTLVKFIREEANNKFARIILRTGQPGQAPEERVVIEYDINDYKEKTELTSQKLVTTIVSALRTYRDILTIESNRHGLEKIIEASRDIFQRKSLQKFTIGVLTQLTSLLDLKRDAIYCHSSFAATQQEHGFIVKAATGKYLKIVNQNLEEALCPEVYAFLRQAIETETPNIVDENRHVGFFKSKTGSKNIIYFEGHDTLSELDCHLVNIFFSNVSIAFDNIYLNKEFEDTQREIIFTLGETIECRSPEAGNHVRRVSEYMHLLALKYGLPESEAEILRLASPLHDLGKLAIPDTILHKPEELTTAEFETIKKHPGAGYDLLKASRREVFMAAAIIAHQHHERYDGLGYPLGLRGKQIHLYGRLAAVVDVFDSLISDRVYRKAWDVSAVVEHMRAQRGKHFDPDLVDILLVSLDAFLELRDKHLDGQPSVAGDSGETPRT
jgi:response regulator RpfG family c-di-GMP phosphodiesterase